MSALPIPRTYTFEEYLEIDRNAEFRSELINGYIYAMAGASRTHNLIAVNLSREISFRLKGRPCESYVADMRLMVESTGRVAFPDLMAACGELVFADDRKDTLLNPLALLEVLSPSTEADDRGEKFAHYRRIPSLQEYVLISQDRMRVEHYVRSGEQWILTEYNDPHSALNLRSISCEVLLSDIYDKVVFETAENTPAGPTPSS